MPIPGFDPSDLYFLLFWCGAFGLLWGLGCVWRPATFSIESGIPAFSAIFSAHLFALSLTFEFGGGGPSAGTVPAAIAAMLFPFSLTQLVQSLRNSANSMESGQQCDSAARLRLFSIVVLVIVYLICIPQFGFYLSSALFLLTSFLVLGSRAPVPMLAVTGGWCVLVYVLFTLVLKVPLPTWGGG